MNPEPAPCSTCGRRRICGKTSSHPGGSRWLSPRSTCCDLMNTTAGLTCSATATNALPISVAGLAAGIWNCAPAAWAAGTNSAVPPLFGTPSVDANASPNTNARATKAPNLSQSRVRTAIVQSRFCMRVYRRLFLLVVIHDLVVGVDDVVLLLGRGLRRTSSGRRLRARGAGTALRGIERRAGSGVCLLQLIQCPGDLVCAPRAEGLFRPLDRLVEPGLERGIELLDPFFRVLLYLVHHRVEAVTPLDLLTPPLVLRRVGLRILDHPVDVFVTEPRGGLHPALLLPSRCPVFCGDVQDAEDRSEEHTSELQSPCNLVCRLLLEKKNTIR